MDELVQWLRAQLDEDERDAQDALKRTTTTRRRIGGEWVEDTVQPPEWRRSVWDPARVLREIDAKRRMVTLHAKDEHYDGCVICDNGNNSCGCMGGWHWKYPCDTLKILALPYADRPGYRDEWRP